MKPRRSDWLWLPIYGLLMTAVVWSLVAARRQILAEMAVVDANYQANDQARGEWQRWKDAADKQSGVEQPVEGPVQRRQIKFNEPPTLILMRDYFPMVMTAAIVFSSVIFAFLMLVIRGMLFSRKPV